MVNFICWQTFQILIYINIVCICVYTKRIVVLSIFAYVYVFYLLEKLEKKSIIQGNDGQFVAIQPNRLYICMSVAGPRLLTSPQCCLIIFSYVIEMKCAVCLKLKIHIIIFYNFFFCANMYFCQRQQDQLRYIPTIRLPSDIYSLTKVAKNCRSNLIKHSPKCNTAMVWAPKQSGIPDNCLEDELAKDGTILTLIKLTYVAGLLVFTAKYMLKLGVCQRNRLQIAEGDHVQRDQTAVFKITRVRVSTSYVSRPVMHQHQHHNVVVVTA